MSQLSQSRHPDIDPSAPAHSEELAREQALKQIERKRRFKISSVIGAIGMAILVVIWALTEYHNAGGWPTDGFSQSSGVPNVWNFWIIYPVGAWLFLMAGHAWLVYGNKPVSESEIKREMERQAGPR